MDPVTEMFFRQGTAIVLMVLGDSKKIQPVLDVVIKITATGTATLRKMGKQADLDAAIDKATTRIV